MATFISEIQPDIGLINTQAPPIMQETEKRLQDQQEQIAKLEQEMDAIRSYTVDLGTAINVLQGQMKDVEQKYLALVSKLDGHENQIKTNTEKVSYLVTDVPLEVSLLEAYLQTNPQMETSEFHKGYRKMGEYQTPPINLSNQKIGKLMRGRGWTTRKLSNNRHEYIREPSQGSPQIVQPGQLFLPQSTQPVSQGSPQIIRPVPANVQY